VEPTFVLIPSPLLGPATWESTADALERRGRRTAVPSLQGVAASAEPYWPVGVDAVVRSAGDGPVVLVPHSNAGLFVPAVVDELGDRVQGVVFVDAALPGTGAVAPRDFLATLADSDGRLPPWTSWWGDADVATLFPNAEVRARVEAEQPRLPLAYYDNLPPTKDGWDRSPCAYLWFGEPYDVTAETASARGWTTRHLPGNHLQMLADPDAVADAVLDLAGELVT
jgi:pimeloyl-ACP methyl ester carboxylesterase